MTSIIAGSGDAPRYPSVSVGVHKARCVKIIDLGTQKSDFNGEISWKRQVLIIFETPEELNSEGQPLTISKFYTLSLHEKANLGNDLSPLTLECHSSFLKSKISPLSLTTPIKKGSFFSVSL